MDFKELVSPSLKELFIKEIERMIFSGELNIGDRLPPERELAKKMSVSQTVINTGIVELAGAGLLEVVPRKGTFVADYINKGTLEILGSLIEYNVAQFDAVTWSSFLDIRACMERDFVRLAAENHSDEDMRKIRAFLRELSQAKNPSEEADAAFCLEHAIAAASGNIIYSLLNNNFMPLYKASFKVARIKSESREYIALYSRLVDLIEACNAEEAVVCAIELVQLSRDILIE